MDTVKTVDNEPYRYFDGNKCKSCGYVAKGPADETKHIQTCPVNPFPGYVATVAKGV